MKNPTRKDIRAARWAHRMALAEGRAVRVITPSALPGIRDDVSVVTFPTVADAQQHVDACCAAGLDAYRLQVSLEQQAEDAGLPRDTFLK